MNVEGIRVLARQFSQAGKAWHFHILTPDCMLNDTGMYALILENTTDHTEQAVYSEEPYMGIGEELVKLLHGSDVVRAESDSNPIPPSAQVSEMLVRAKALSAKGIFWHHHMLFPGCKYNTHGNNYVLIFEDAETGKKLESISESEPKADLQYIESLFYAQKNSGSVKATAK